MADKIYVIFELEDFDSDDPELAKLKRESDEVIYLHQLKKFIDHLEESDEGAPFARLVYYEQKNKYPEIDAELEKFKEEVNRVKNLIPDDISYNDSYAEGLLNGIRRRLGSVMKSIEDYKYHSTLADDLIENKEDDHEE